VTRTQIWIVAVYAVSCQQCHNDCDVITTGRRISDGAGVLRPPQDVLPDLNWQSGARVSALLYYGCVNE